MKKCTQANLDSVLPRLKKGSRYPLARFILACSTSIFIVSFSSAQDQSDGDKIKARVDNSRLSTDEREQQILRRLQNRPSTNPSATDGINRFGKMSFEPDEDEAKQNTEEVDQSIKTRGNVTNAPLRDTSRETNSAQIRDEDDRSGERELVDDLNDTKPRYPTGQAQQKRLNNRQAKQPNLAGEDPDRADSPVAPKGVSDLRGVAPEQGESERDVSSAKNQRIRIKRPSNDDPPAKSQLDENPDEPGSTEQAMEADPYESLEESSETAHLSRGAGRKKDLNPLSEPNEDLSRDNKRLDQGSPGLGRSKPNSGEAKGSDNSNTETQIQQLESLKENLNLQRELASSQGKITELSRELEDTKKRLLSAEKQVEELSQRLQYLGDRRTLSSDSFYQRSAELEPQYGRGAAKPDDYGRGAFDDDRDRSRRNNDVNTDEYRGRGGPSRMNEIRDVNGAPSNRSDRDQPNSMGLGKRYDDDQYRDQQPVQSGLEIPRQIESDSNTPLVSVIDDDVQLRSGPDTKYPSVMRLRKGERIVVEEQSAGWLQIIAPNGARAWIETRSTNFDSISRGARGSLAPSANFERGGRVNPQMSVEDRALELIRRGTGPR